MRSSHISEPMFRFAMCIAAVFAVAATRFVLLAQQDSLLSAAQDGQLRISVSATAIGWPGDQADPIFDVFYTTKPHRTGMGLAITLRIAEAHGGGLSATANASRGATFRFTLPRTEAAHA